MLMLLQSMIEQEKDQGWLPNAPLDVEYGNNITNQSTTIANPKRNP